MNHRGASNLELIILASGLWAIFSTSWHIEENPTIWDIAGKTDSSKLHSDHFHSLYDYRAIGMPDEEVRGRTRR